MQVTELWRYPAKTMAGEKVPRVRPGPLGIDGDRVVMSRTPGAGWSPPARIRASWAMRARWTQMGLPWVPPLLVATDGAIAAFGHDARRLRPNIVIGGVEGLAEREWPGGCLRIGPVLIGVQDLRLRCIMTSYDPGTLIQDREITRSIYRRFEGKLALNCFVIAGGEIAVGDDVQLVRGRACAESTASAVFAEYVHHGLRLVAHP